MTALLGGLLRILHRRQDGWKELASVDIILLAPCLEGHRCLVVWVRRRCPDLHQRQSQRHRPSCIPIFCSRWTGHWKHPCRKLLTICAEDLPSLQLYPLIRSRMSCVIFNVLEYSGLERRSSTINLPASTDCVDQRCRSTRILVLGGHMRLESFRRS